MYDLWRGIHADGGIGGQQAGIIFQCDRCCLGRWRQHGLRGRLGVCGGILQIGQTGGRGKGKADSADGQLGFQRRGADLVCSFEP